MNVRIVAYLIGWVLKIEAVAMVIPGVVALVYRENTWYWFLICAAVAGAAGVLLSGKKNRKGNFYAREGYAGTALSWILMSAVGALPFFLSGRIPHYMDALFEIVSGFTTTGASVLSDVESLGRGLLFWRSFSHWLGGMGVLVLLLAILPFSGGGSHMVIMKAESPGPQVSKLVPRVRETAIVLYGIYTVLTVIMIITYLLSGMRFFDAVCIAFGTAGTGGFCVRNDGMASYNNVSIVLTIFWMLVFGVNFNIYYLILKKKWKDALKSEELRAYLSIFLTSALIMTAVTFISIYSKEIPGAGGFFMSLRDSAFTAASIQTTTGFATADFSHWPIVCRWIILLLMVFGASAGSTGGGVKVARIVLLLKEAKSELHYLIHPNAVKPIKFEGKVVEKTVLRSLNSYVVIYLVILILSVFLVSLDPASKDFETAYSAVLATYNNIGPGLSIVSPLLNYGSFNVLTKLVLIFDMIAGRLELLPMLALFNPTIWKRKFM